MSVFNFLHSHLFTTFYSFLRAFNIHIIKTFLIPYTFTFFLYLPINSRNRVQSKFMTRCHFLLFIRPDNNCHFASIIKTRKEPLGAAAKWWCWIELPAYPFLSLSSPGPAILLRFGGKASVDHWSFVERPSDQCARKLWWGDKGIKIKNIIRDCVFLFRKLIWLRKLGKINYNVLFKFFILNHLFFPCNFKTSLILFKIHSTLFQLPYSICLFRCNFRKESLKWICLLKRLQKENVKRNKQTKSFWL